MSNATIGSPTNGGSERRFGFSGMEGDTAKLRAGTCGVMRCNNDTEAVPYDTDDFDIPGECTRAGIVPEPIHGNAANCAPRTGGTEGERGIITPGMTQGCTAAEAEITDAVISCICIPRAEKRPGAVGEVGAIREVRPTADGLVMTLYPHYLTCTCTCEVRNMKHPEYVSPMCGTLSGMARSIRFGD